MFKMGRKEAEAATKVIMSGNLFRYSNSQSQCEKFEKRFARYLGVQHAAMTPSGTEALRAALVGLGVGPGDEVIVPACTFMASALAVLAVGAIPVIIDIDESITISPEALADSIGPRTRAVMPVHMWGMPCDMNPIMEICRKSNVLVVEDACQAAGGAYEGRKLGSIGHAAAFSFNFYKTMSCGEGGAVVTNDDSVIWKARCTNECCRFYWDGRDPSRDIFASSGSRVSEISGAVMNEQLSRLESMITSMRQTKKRILEETAKTQLKPVKANSIDHESGTHVMYLLPTREAAKAFRHLAGGVIASQTGRHVYTEWDPVLQHKAAHHPALNPYNMKENQGCRMNYSLDMCARSLDILDRTVMLHLSPGMKRSEVTAMIKNIRQSAVAALSGEWTEAADASADQTQAGKAGAR